MKTLPLFVVALVACGGNVTDGSTDVPGQPPSPPNANDSTPATTVTTTYAIDQLLLGDEPRDGSAPSSSAWKSYGYDLDHLTTTKDSTNVCTRAAGAPEVNQLDGNDGIDNAWGSLVVPLLQAGLNTQTPSEAASFALEKGATTLKLAVTGVPADPSASALGLALVASFADQASHFAASYESRGTFVSGAGDAPIALAIPFVVNDAPIALALSIHDAVVTFGAVDEKNISGTIAGVLDVGELSASVSTFAKSVDPTYFAANPDAIQGIVSQIVQATDILLDGTNASGVRCSALSIGIGFTARRTE